VLPLRYFCVGPLWPRFSCDPTQIPRWLRSRKESVPWQCVPETASLVYRLPRVSSWNTRRTLHHTSFFKYAWSLLLCLYYCDWAFTTHILSTQQLNTIQKHVLSRHNRIASPLLNHVANEQMWCRLGNGRTSVSKEARDTDDRFRYFFLGMCKCNCIHFGAMQSVTLFISISGLVKVHTMGLESVCVSDIALTRLTTVERRGKTDSTAAEANLVRRELTRTCCLRLTNATAKNSDTNISL
jgi:hypothetical protein